MGKADANGHLGTVYLVHFERRLAHAQHYLGWTSRPEVRVEEHRNGRGSRLLAAVQTRGIPWRVVRRWRGTRKDERRMKDHRHGPRWCPICSTNPRSPSWPGIEEINPEL